MRPNTVCKLCGNSSRLIKQSHIIPEFMYKKIKDDRNRMSLVPTMPSEKGQIVQTGFFEKNILCRVCENERFAKLERYVSQVLYNGGGDALFQKQKNLDGATSLGIQGLDYKKFKLFALSILWKAHISDHRFFAKINLPDHENRLRTMLLNDDAGRGDEYQIGIIAVKDTKGELVRMFSNPDVVRSGSDYFSIFFIAGFFYFINLKSDPDFVLFKKYSLTEDGKIEIPVLFHQQAHAFLKAAGMSDDIANYFCT